MRFILEESANPGYWVCTDTDNMIVCIFRDKDFNGEQKFTTLKEGEKIDASKLARVAREMADWLRENHYNKLF